MEHPKARAVIVSGDYEGLINKTVLFTKHNSAVEYFYRFIDHVIPFIMQDDDSDSAIDYHEIKASLLAKQDESNFISKDYTVDTQVIGDNTYLFAQVIHHHDSMDVAVELKELNIYESTSSAESVEGLDIQED